MNAPLTLEALTAAWIAAKQAERDAQEQRRTIEEAIAAVLPGASPESSVTAECGDYRVNVKYAVTRKVDGEALQRMWDKLPISAQVCFRWKFDVVLAKLRGLKEFDPQTYGEIAPCITVAPSRPSVSVEAIERKAA